MKFTESERGCFEMNSLITKSLEESELRWLLDFPKEIMKPVERLMVDWIQDFTVRYGEPPRITRFTGEFELFIPLFSEDPLGDIYQRTLKRKRNLYTRDFLMEMEESLKRGDDPLEGIARLHQTIQGKEGDTVFYSSFDRGAFLRRPQSYSYGIRPLDKHTGGASQGDLIYIIGRLGTGKTTLTMWMVKKWILRGHKLLLVSNENTPTDIIGKIDSMIGAWNPLKKRTGEWSDSEKNRLRAVGYLASKSPGEIIMPSHPINDPDVLHTLIQSYAPDIVVVDGVYLMGGRDSKSTWERVSDVSRKLKQIAIDCSVPIVGVSQANREAAGRERIGVVHAALSDSIGQDSDLLLAVNQMEEDGRVFVEAIKNRWGKSAFGFFIEFFWDRMAVRVYDEKFLKEEEEEEM